jgi:hypothetical protein
MLIRRSRRKLTLKGSVVRDMLIEYGSRADRVYGVNKTIEDFLQTTLDS